MDTGRCIQPHIIFIEFDSFPKINQSEIIAERKYIFLLIFGT